MAMPHRRTICGGSDSANISRSSLAVLARAPFALQLLGSGGAAGLGTVGVVVALGKGEFAYSSGHRAVVLVPKSGTMHEAGGWLRTVYDQHDSTITCMKAVCTSKETGEWLIGSGSK